MMDSDSGAVTLSAIGRIKILISSADCLILDAMGGRGWVVPVEGFCCENELRRDPESPLGSELNSFC